MHTIRIALIEVTPRLRDIVSAAVAATGDIEVMPYDPGEHEGGPAPDAVICQVRDPMDLARADALLRRLPRARMVMVADSAERAAVYELQPTRRVMVNVSIEDLIEAIRVGVDTERQH